MKKIILFIFLFFINIITNANYNKIYSYNKTCSYDKIEDIKIDEVTEYNSNSNIIGSLFKEFLYGQEKLVNKPFINFNFGLCENLLPNKLGITTSQLINSSKLT